MAEILLAEQELTFGSSGVDGLYLWQAANPAFTFIDGETYTIIWDGVQYVDVATTANINGLTGVGVGNSFIAGVDTDTGEPFLFGTLTDGSAIMCYSTDAGTSHTVAIYLGEVSEEPESGIVLKDRDGNDVTYSGVASIRLMTTSGEMRNFITADIVETTVEPDFSGGDMEVTPGVGEVFGKVTVKKPETLLPENIAKDMTIAGVTGTFQGGASDIVLEGDFLKYVVYKINFETRTLTIYGILYETLYADTGTYDVNIPDTFGEFAVEIAAGGVM